MKDYTLSDGTFVPKGTYMLTPSSASNFDPEIWGPKPQDFDPWRFQRRRLVKGQETLHSLVQTTPEFTYFGYVYTADLSDGTSLRRALTFINFLDMENTPVQDGSSPPTRSRCC